MPEDKGKTEGEQEPQEEWKVRFKDGTVFAPVAYDNLAEWYQSGQIDAETPVARNVLTAEWVQFKETDGFAVAKAAKEGQQVFCISCGSPWPVGTKLCTKCGTFLGTGEKIAAAGEKKPERRFKLGRKTGMVTPEEAAVAEAGEVVETPVAEEAVEVAEPGMAAEMPAEEVPLEGGIEAPAVAEAAEAVVPARRKKGGKKIIGLAVAVAAVVVALAILAPEQMSGIVEKVKGLVGQKTKVSGEKEKAEQKWVGVDEEVRSAIESVQARISSALSAVPFAQGQKANLLAEIAEFLREAVEEFTERDAFVSLATSLTEQNLREAARFLEEEKSLLGAESPTPRIDAIQGVIQTLLGREKEGMPLLASAAEEGRTARMAAIFCRGAVEGCLERFLPAQGRKDPWGTAADILGVTKDAFADERLARHCGKALSGLAVVQALTQEMGPAPAKGTKFRTKAFLNLFRRGDPAVQAALVELGKTDPARRRSVLKHKPVRVAYVLRLMSEAGRAGPGAGRGLLGALKGGLSAKPGSDTRLLDALKEGLSADPENAFYNYALAAVYLGMKKDEEAIAEVAAGNEKPVYRDYSKERMAGLAEVLDTPLPYTTAAVKVSCPQLTALASSSQRLLNSAWSWFRVGRRKEAFEMLGQWRTACARLRGQVCTFRDGLAVVSASAPLMAAESQLCKRDGRVADAWNVRKALVENWRLALAVEYGAAYGLSAEVFVKEVLSEEGYEDEFSRSSPHQALAQLWAKAAQRLDGILGQDPANVPMPAANVQDPYYVAATTALNQGQYEAAFERAIACLGRNPKHLWALKVMQEAVRSVDVQAEISEAKAVMYTLLRKRDVSLPGAKRLEYGIEVGQGTTKEEAVATARSALQGFLRKEKADAVRIYVTREGSPLLFVRLDWAPGGDWQKAKSGTPDTQFEESVKVFDIAPL